MADPEDQEERPSAPPDSVAHGTLEFALLALLAPFRFDGSPGAEGGWLFAVAPAIAWGKSGVHRPLFAGWRRERLNAFPATVPLSIAPDFVVDQDLPGALARREQRLQWYFDANVTHVWLVEVNLRRLTVLRRGAAAYDPIEAGEGSARFVAEPFGGGDFTVAELFGDDDVDPES